MGDVHAVLTKGEQARFGQSLQDHLDRLGVSFSQQLSRPHAPACVLRSFSEGGEAQEDVFGDVLLSRIQVAEDALGRLGDGLPHPPASR
jgi:hypothetical protein